MPRPYKNDEIGPSGPAIGSAVVAPSDTVDLPRKVRGITIDVGGTITWRDWDGIQHVTAALPPGTYGLFASRILATGTTATDITGWF